MLPTLRRNLLHSQSLQKQLMFSLPFPTICCQQILHTRFQHNGNTDPPSKYNSKLGIVTHPSCLLHEINGHPESPQRLKIILESLNNPEINDNDDDWSKNIKIFDNPTQITRAVIAAVHQQSHVDDILEKAEDASENNKIIQIDPDTSIGPHSSSAIIYAPACVTYAVDILLNNNDHLNEYNDYNRIFVAIRPPGHHAEYDRCLGFCIFNNIFIGAKYAQQLFSTKYDEHNCKIAIIDFDVHHGNGTQALSWNESNILYISLHQYDGEGMFYPGTGGSDETGAFDNVLNVPLNAGADGNDIKDAFNNKILDKLNNFKPDLVMISAGFDGHKDDPLANLDYTESDYEWMTEQIVNVANEHSNGRIISVLEGGYNLDSLKSSVIAHIKQLCV